MQRLNLSVWIEDALASDIFVAIAFTGASTSTTKSSTTPSTATTTSSSASSSSSTSSSTAPATPETEGRDGADGIRDGSVVGKDVGAGDAEVGELGHLLGWNAFGRVCSLLPLECNLEGTSTACFAGV